MEVYFSNRVEALFGHFKEKLYQASSPFARRLVIVPSPPLKSWLMLQLAKEQGIAAGLEIGYLDETVQKVKKISEKKPSELHIPSNLELSLAIEWEIQKILQEPRQEIWEELLNYLGPSSRKQNRRLNSLSIKLSHLFTQYGKYGASFLTKWESGWQKLLWNRIFTPQSPWTYLYQELSKPIDLCAADHVSLHLFSMSFLPKIQFHFLCNVAKFIPVHFYQLSPCQMFWSDILTSKESQKLRDYWRKKKISENQQRELESYLKDCNPLLANFGKLGREMILQIEESQALTKEDYQEIEEKSVLHSIQGDILHLRNPLQKDFVKDNTIQVHSTPTLLREIEVLHDILLNLNVEPHEIIVMAPDIMQYEPFIKAVFHAEKGLEAQITDLRASSQHPLVQGFLHLLEIPSGRWEATSLLQLFDCVSFQKRQNLKNEEIATFKKWIRESGIRWGLDEQNRENLLKLNHCPNGSVEPTFVGTWQFGFERLLSGLTQISEDSLSIAPSESELLGRLIQLIEDLKTDLNPILDGNTYSLDEWSLYFQKLLLKYFKAQEVEDQVLLQQLDIFKSIAKHLKGATYPFKSIHKHLLSHLTQSNANYKESLLHAVRFCSLLPMRTLPAKAIVLLGMQEGAFPRQEVSFSLNLLQGEKRSDYCPSQEDLDRYLFLEALLSAREFFILSYQNRSTEDYKELAPSIIVAELMNYLEKGYKIPSNQITLHHPLNGFDKFYFEPNTPFKSFSEEHFLAARAFYQQEKEKTHCFIPSFSIQKKEPSDSLTVDLKELSNFAKDPLKLYFNKTLGIYLHSQEERKIPTKDTFILNPLEFDLFRKMAQQYPLDQAFAQADQKGLLPKGLFKFWELNKLKKEIESYHLDPRECFSVEFSDLYSKPFSTTEGNWKLPALELPLSTKQIKIKGRINNLSQQGMFIFAKRDFDAIVRYWPQYLVFQLLLERYALPFLPDLKMLKSGHSLSPFKHDPQVHLQLFLEYYLSGIKTGSPLFPKWVKYFLNDPLNVVREKMKQEIENAFNPLYSNYFQWHARNMELPEIDGWQFKAQELFVKPFEQWFPRSKNKEEPYA